VFGEVLKVGVCWQVLHHKTDVSTLCGVCLVSLESVGHLRAHVAHEHAAVLERPNTCRVCAKACGGRYKTLAHIKRCHGNLVEACKECCAIFDKADDLDRHMKKVHKGGDNSALSADEEDDDEQEDEDEEEEPSKDGVGRLEGRPQALPQVQARSQPPARSQAQARSQPPARSQPQARPAAEPVHLNGTAALQTHHCAHCPKSFKHRKDMTRHVRRKHVGAEPGDGVERRLACGACIQRFKTENELLAHYLKAHSELTDSGKKKEAKSSPSGDARPRRLYKCNLCKESFRMPSQLMQHQKLRHRSDTQTLKCSSCDKTFSNKVIHLKHEVICRREREHSMSILQQSLELGKIKLEMDDMDEYDGFGGHFMDSVDSETNHVGEAGLGTPSGGSGKPPRHSRKVYGETAGPVKCPLCDKHWPALKHQWQHLIRTHREAAATTCGVCLKVCSSYKTLATHLHAAHPGHLERGGNNFTCQICGRYHNARSKLELHNAIHLGLENESSPGPSLFTCSTCFKVFSTSESLEMHALNHRAKGPPRPHAQDNTPKGKVPANKSPGGGVENTKHCDRLAESDSDSGDDSSSNDYSCQRCNKMSFSSYLQLTKHYKFCTSPDKSAKKPAVKTNSASAEVPKKAEVQVKREPEHGTEDSRELNSESQGTSSETVSDKVSREKAGKNWDASDESEKKSEGGNSDSDSDSDSDDSSDSSDDSDDSSSSDSDSKSGSKSDSSDSDDDKEDDEGERKDDDESRRAVENLVNDIGTFGSPIYESG